MINREQLFREYPKALHIHKRHILREYLQHLLLKQIFLSPLAHKLFFIGGTSLRLIYQNQRFSEDLDFDCNDVTLEEFNDMITYVIGGLAYWGIEADWSVSHKEAMHGYIRCKHVLTQFGLAPDTREEVQEKLLIRIDAHDQGYTFESDKKILKGFGIQSVVPTAPLPLLMSHKIATIGQRKRAKGRDYFDLVFLMAKNVQPDMRYLQEKIDVFTADGISTRLLDAYKDAGSDYLIKDVKPFLFNPFDDSIAHFETYVKEYERNKNEELKMRS